VVTVAEVLEHLELDILEYQQLVVVVALVELIV
jgi:hypothetical protein